MHNDPTKPQALTPSKSLTEGLIHNCPHWAPTSKACLLVKDGLFLPVHEHIAAYCSSQHYLSCHHYQLLTTLQDAYQQDNHLPINRRRSIRVPRYHIFRFSEINNQSQSPEYRTEETWTIDISEHGIRFASYRYLTPDTMIRFSLEGEKKGRNTNGHGRIIWAEPLENTPLFHAGISFTD